MSEQADLLGRVRVAKPCSASWERMEGNARVRFCHECNLSVYNLSEMTSREAASLVASTEGRLCGRMYLRADGTILTKDCPVGMRALRRRVSRATGAAFASLLGLFMVANGQTPSGKQKQHSSKKSSCATRNELRVEKTVQAGFYSTLSGVVTDVQCSLISGAEVNITNKSTGQKHKASTSDEGKFRIPVLSGGTYTVTIDSPGFQRFLRNDFYIGGSESVYVDVILQVGALMGEVIIIETNNKPDFESSGGKTVIRGRMLTDLPIPR